MNDVTVHTFPSGLTLVHRRNTANSIVGMVLFVQTGSSEESEDKAGLTNLMMRVLPKGTRNRSADDISEQLGLLGASLVPAAGKDFSTISVQCIRDETDACMDILADVLFNPTFPQEEVELEKKKILAGIRMGEDQNTVVASKRFMKEVFGRHPYGVPTEGLAETIPGLLPIELHDKHRGVFVPSNMILSIVGNIEFEEALEIVGRHFPPEYTEKERRYLVDKVIAPAASRSVVIKETEQAFVVLGTLTCPAGHPDEPAVEVASTILGAGMSSRLFTELRDKRGLAYSVGASSNHYKFQGYMMVHMGTNPANLFDGKDKLGREDAERSMWIEVQNLRHTPVSEDELDRAKNYIAGEYLRHHERNLQQARYLGYWHLTGRGVDYDQRYLEEIRSVTSRDVMKIANKYFLDPTTVVVTPELAVVAPEPIY